jgi:hypothetical protein
MTRKITNRIHDALDNGTLSYQQVAEAALIFMNEDQVAEMAHAEEFFAYEDDEADDDSDDPSDYLFHVYQSQGLWEEASPIMTLVTICPEAYFRETGAQWDQHIPLGLSEDMDELQEGLFEYAGDVDEARKELLAMGLREDPEYSEFIQKHIPNDED